MKLQKHNAKPGSHLVPGCQTSHASAVSPLDCSAVWTIMCCKTLLLFLSALWTIQYLVCVLLYFPLNPLGACKYRYKSRLTPSGLLFTLETINRKKRTEEMVYNAKIVTIHDNYSIIYIFRCISDIYLHLSVLYISCNHL